MHAQLFSPIKIGPLELSNRLIMAPLYLGYAAEGGGVSELLLDHYRLMAASGVALVVVENATVDHPEGSGSHRTLRADTDANREGLERLAAAIQGQGARAALQINHAGRFAGAAEAPLAPSPVEAFGRLPRPMQRSDFPRVRRAFAAAARRVQASGFDLVELHGGTGYLLAQFVSPRTNRRGDEYGGTLANRMRFPLEVLAEVKDAVGDFPVGWRLLADEWLDDGLHLDEGVEFAARLAESGVAYLSVMGGTYESFFLPEIVERCKQPGYMTDLAAAVKRAVAEPVVTAGRIATGDLAEQVLASGRADLIGLARVLWADPEWPRKVAASREDEIIHCDPDCGDGCTQQVMKGRAAVCLRWPKAKMKAWKAR